MRPLHKLWALALWTDPQRLMMGTKPQYDDFHEWIAQIDSEYQRYLDMCEKIGHTPCSREVIFHEARQTSTQPVVLLRTRIEGRHP